MKKFILSLALAAVAPLAFIQAQTVDVTSSNVNQVMTNQYVILDIYADWCGPCKQLAPVYQALSNEMGNKYTFAKLNAPQQAQVASKYHVTGYPTLIFFKNGQEVGRTSGFVSRDRLIQMTNQYFK